MMLFVCIISQLIVKGLSKNHLISLVLMNSFLKSPRPSLPLKRAPPLSPSPFPLRGQGMCQPPYSVLKPLRFKVGGPSEVFASSGAAFCGMRPHGYKSLTGCLLGACLQFALCWLLAGCSMLDGCLLMQELLPDFLPIYEAFAFIVELKA